MNGVDGLRTLRRRLVAQADGMTVRAGLEDDYHHIELVLAHDGRVVTGIEADTIRLPWTTCPDAVERLPDLFGLPLSLRPVLTVFAFNPKHHCTHLFDLACFAMAEACRGGHRQYDMAIPDRTDGRTRAEIRRDGAPLFHWDMAADDITTPGPFAGRNVKTLAKWAADALDDDGFEATTILRRGLMITRGRQPADARQPLPTELMSGMSGACYTFTPGTAERSGNIGDTVRDFTHHPERMLQHFSA